MSYRFVPPRYDVGDGIPNFGGAKLSFYDFGTTNAKTTYSDFALTTANADPVVADADGMFPDIFLDIQASVTLKTSADVVIYGPIKIYAPEDGITSLAASAVSVLDAAGNFTATNVETVLLEISDDWGKLARTNTWSAIQTHTAAVQMSDQEVRRPLLVDYAIKHMALTQTTGTIDLDMSVANSFAVTLTENATLTISNPPATGNLGEVVVRITQDGGGGAYTVTLPAGTDATSAATYTMTTTNNARDKLVFSTIDAGTVWDIDYGQAYG